MSGRPGMYTHTLDLQNLGDIDGIDLSLPRLWFLVIATMLPNLRSLNLANVKFLSHTSLSSSLASVECLDNLTFLNISRCQNLTLESTVQLLSRTPHLYYLDVSGNSLYGTSSKSSSTVRMFCTQIRSGLKTLQILKAKNTKLQWVVALHYLFHEDLNLPPLLSTPSCIRQLKSFDLGQNGRITDAVIEDLVTSFIKLRSSSSNGSLPPPYSMFANVVLRSNRIIMEDEWQPYFGHFRQRTGKSQLQLEFSDVEPKVVHQLRSPEFLASIRSNPASSTINLTHLYLSHTSVTAVAIACFLLTLPLQFLDCGDVEVSISDVQYLGMKFHNRDHFDENVAAAQLILAALPRCTTLQHLRVSHCIVTGYGAMADINHIQKPRKPMNTSIRSIRAILDALKEFVAVRSTPQGRQWQDLTGQHHEVVSYMFTSSLLSIEKLILTSVPTTSERGFVSTCLKSFLLACGEMERISAQYHWLQEHPDEVLPDRLPSSKRPIGIRELVLEMLPSTKEHTDGYDNDLATYEAAGQDDFSFYPEERVTSSAQQRSTDLQNSTVKLHPDNDVVSVLRQFRQRQKSQQEKSLSKGFFTKDETDSFWGGNVSVVRDT
ncbi:hypothetical protein M501DRAFT_127311 [Patellaria atrata CBS 101060]|uniref:RNI-like protein n=1 Tax=Patellaria atrata CBS 101060 TaxID=1346257 RepID=A0A9P4VXG1_9PEZI|nr:hypothetical protein M501DRAFT_127311 [Patellaria atrata CBS 101060]